VVIYFLYWRQFKQQVRRLPWGITLPCDHAGDGTADCALGTGAVCGRATIVGFRKKSPANAAAPASDMTKTTLGLMPENLERPVEK
jgi:hypothetical protein